MAQKPRNRATQRPDIVITDDDAPSQRNRLTKRIGKNCRNRSSRGSYTKDAYRLMASDSGADAFVNKRVINDALPAIRDLIRRISGGSGPFAERRHTSFGSVAEVTCVALEHPS
jgi:hypothetical protein